MTITNEELSDIFGVAVLSCETVLGNGMGLRLVVKTGSNISSTCHGGFRGPLIQLVKQSGFVVIEGAALSLHKKVELSGPVTIDRMIGQDMFHRDPFEGITALANLGERRDAPTYYAKYLSVADALRTIDTSRWKPEARALFDAQLDPDYDFVAGRDNIPRQAVMQGIPELTQFLGTRIPPDELYNHRWTSKPSVVFHSNARGGILHARPHSPSDIYNNLSGYEITLSN